MDASEAAKDVRFVWLMLEIARLLTAENLSNEDRDARAFLVAELENHGFAIPAVWFEES